MTFRPGIAESRRAAWLRRTPIAVFVAFAVALAMLLANGIIADHNIRASAESALRVAHTLQVMEKIRQVSNLLLMAESSMRGYVITGKDLYLAPYRRGREDGFKRIDELKGLVADNDEQLVQVGAMRALANVKFDQIDRVLAAYRDAGHDAAVEAVSTDEGQRAMDQIRAVYTDMLRTEARLLGARRGQSENTIVSAETSLLLSSVAIALALCIFYILVHRYLRQRDVALGELQASNRQLEQRVAQRTAELQDLSQYLFSVREDEKKKMARELHDEFGSYLTAINMDVSRIRDKIAGSHPEHAAKLERTIGLIGQTIEMKRRIITDLRPSLLDNLGLAAALEQYIEDWTQHTGIAVHFSSEGDLEEAEDGCPIAVYRVFQEALTNVAKHSRATGVTASLRRVGDNLMLEIADDGVGIDDATRSKPGSHGLIGMRERVHAFRGTVEVLRGQERGTIVRASVPCRKKAA